ncbi:MAG: hypothetical protein NT154_26450 [Verrucomicrobia bacterium]|nr:hypothetical protein [Verrucomicrobiota bacterium]
MKEAFNTKRDERWIQEALESGPEQPLSRAKFDAAFLKARQRFDESNEAGLLAESRSPMRRIFPPAISVPRNT